MRADVWNMYLVLYVTVWSVSSPLGSELPGRAVISALLEYEAECLF